MFSDRHEKYRPIDDEEEIEYRERRPRRVPWQALIIVALSSGWITTALISWRNYASSLPSPSPVPGDVLYPRIKKVFEKDERYVGPSLEAARNWDALVAGIYKMLQKYLTHR
jgi:hypothetical protein